MGNIHSSSPGYASVKASASNRSLSSLPIQRIAAPQCAARAGTSLPLFYGTEAQQPVRSRSTLEDMYVITNSIFEAEAGQHRPAADEEDVEMAGSCRDLSAFGSPFRTSHDNVLYDDSSFELTPLKSLPDARLFGEALATALEPVVGMDQRTRSSSTASQTCEGANTPTPGTMATVACVDGSEADADVIVREFLSESAGKGCNSSGAGGTTLELLNTALQQPTDTNLIRQLSQSINSQKICESRHCPEQRYRERTANINKEAKAAMIRSALLAHGVAPEVVCTTALAPEYRGSEVAMIDLVYLCQVLDTLKDSKIRGLVFTADCSAHIALSLHNRESQRLAAAGQGLSSKQRKSLEKGQELVGAIVHAYEGLLEADEQGDKGLTDGHQKQLSMLGNKLNAWMSEQQSTKVMLAYQAYLQYLSSYRLLVCVAPGLLPASERQCKRWAMSSNGHVEAIHLPSPTPEVELVNAQLLGATWQSQVPADPLSMLPCIEDALMDQQVAYRQYTHALLDRKHLPAVELEAINVMYNTDPTRDEVQAMPACQPATYCPLQHSADGATACVTGPDDQFAAQKLVKAAYHLAAQAQAGLDPSDVDALNKYKAQHSKVLESEEYLRCLEGAAEQTGSQPHGVHPDFDLDAYLEDVSGADMIPDTCWQLGTDAPQGLSQALDEVTSSYHSALADLCSMHDFASSKLREAMSAHESWITILLHLSGQQPQHRFYTEDLPLVFAANKAQCRIPLADWKAIQACYDNSWGIQTCQPTAPDSTSELPPVTTSKQPISLQPSTDLNIECDQLQEAAATAAQKASWEPPEYGKPDGLQQVALDAACKQAEGKLIEAMFAIDAMKRQASPKLLAALKGEEEIQYWDVALCGRESDMATAYGRCRVGAATAKGLDAAVVNSKRTEAARQAAAAKLGLSRADMKVLQSFKDVVCSMWDATEAQLAAEAATTA